MSGSRTNQWLDTVTVAGRDIGTFDSVSGGNLAAESAKWRDGGMGKERSHGGSASRENFTVGRRYDFDRDHPLMPFLENQIGRGEVALKRQPLDNDGNPYGRPRVFTGTLAECKGPDSNAQETSTIGELTLVIDSDEEAA